MEEVGKVLERYEEEEALELHWRCCLWVKGNFFVLDTKVGFIFLLFSRKNKKERTLIWDLAKVRGSFFWETLRDVLFRTETMSVRVIEINVKKEKTETWRAKRQRESLKTHSWLEEIWTFIYGVVPIWHLYLNVKHRFLEGELYIEGEEGFWVLRRGGEPEYTRVWRAWCFIHKKKKKKKKEHNANWLKLVCTRGT